MTETTAIATVSLAQEMGVAEVIAKKRMMDQIFREVMKINVHYGTIPGTPKPSLWQPGAEILGRTFALCPEYDTIDLDGDGRRFRSTCRVRHAPTGAILAEATRVASWYEPTFRWRKATKAEHDEAPVDRRRQTEKMGNRGKYTAYQVESEPGELENAILSRAEKRAHVAAIKTATAASDIFHELDPGPLEGEEEGPGLKRPQKKAGAGKGTPASGPPPDDAPPPEPPDGELPFDDGAGAKGGGSIPQEAWANVRKAWHDKGVVSEAQVRRLYAIASENGWTGSQVNAELRLGVDAELSELPYGKPYDLAVEIFQGFAPEG